MKPIRCEIPIKYPKCLATHLKTHHQNNWQPALGDQYLCESANIYTHNGPFIAHAVTPPRVAVRLSPLSLSLSLLPCCSSSVASASLTNLNSPDLQFKGLSGPYSARLPILIKSAPSFSPYERTHNLNQNRSDLPRDHGNYRWFGMAWGLHEKFYPTWCVVREFRTT